MDLTLLDIDWKCDLYLLFTRIRQPLYSKNWNLCHTRLIFRNIMNLSCTNTDTGTFLLLNAGFCPPQKESSSKYVLPTLTRPIRICTLTLSIEGKWPRKRINSYSDLELQKQVIFIFHHTDTQGHPIKICPNIKCFNWPWFIKLDEYCRNFGNIPCILREMFCWHCAGVQLVQI